MPVNALEAAAEMVEYEVLAGLAHGLSDGAREHILRRVEDWKFGTRLDLAAADPFAELEAKLNAWGSSVNQGNFTETEFSAALGRYAPLCRAVGYPFDAAFWHRQVSAKATSRKEKIGSKSKLQSTGELLQAEWRKVLDRARSEWELKEIQRRRECFIQELRELSKLLESLGQQLEELGLEPGILIDLSKGSLSPQDVDQFKRWAQYLAQDEGVRRLCELLGKLRQVELSTRVERVSSVHVQEVWRPDLNSREEFVGVRLGKDLEHALPSELALLADPDTAILFDVKYVNSRLMCFDMRGMQRVAEEHLADVDRQVTESNSMGPMVICVDTSGSMHGMPETIAKAVALFMASKAKEQGRHCYLINFSTGIETLDLGGEAWMSTLIEFLRMSFHGGTDAAPALRHALKVFRSEGYAKADLLIVSDFVMGELPRAVINAIEIQRTNGNRFYSLVIDSGFKVRTPSSAFDQEWVFDPASSRIQELVDFQRQVEVGTRSVR